MLRFARHLCRDQHGFTLVELLVAMAASIVVVFGLTSIMISTLHQSQRVFSRVDSTRQARAALAVLENQLHSGCVNGSAPVQAGSTPTTLIFVSYYGTSANPSAPVWHQLTFDATGRTLKDSTYNATYNASGTSPGYTQGSFIKTTTLLTNVGAQSGVDVFKYYAYQPEYTDSNNNVWYMVPDKSNIQPGTTSTMPDTPLGAASGLSSAAAGTVVEVKINLLVGATNETINGPTNHTTDAAVSDSVSFRLTTPPNFVPAGSGASGYAPCQ